MELREIAAVLGPAAIWFSALVALFVAIRSIASQREIARKKEALNFLTTSEYDGDLIQKRELFLQLAAESGGLRALLDGPQGKTELEAVRITLNELDLLAVGIQAEIVDFGFVFEAKGLAIMDVWARAQPVVGELRERTGRATLYVSLERLDQELRRAAALRSVPCGGSHGPFRAWHRPGGKLRSVVK